MEIVGKLYLGNLLEDASDGFGRRDGLYATLVTGFDPDIPLSNGELLGQKGGEPLVRLAINGRSCNGNTKLPGWIPAEELIKWGGGVNAHAEPDPPVSPFLDLNHRLPG